MRQAGNHLGSLFLKIRNVANISRSCEEVLSCECKISNGGMMQGIAVSESTDDIRRSPCTEKCFPVESIYSVLIIF
jgi:hypothetical protein